MTAVSHSGGAGQARIVRLLVERVGYDGRGGRVTVTFRSPGVKALRSEALIRGKEVSE